MTTTLGPADDFFVAGPADDSVQAGAGNDTLYGLAGADTILGQLGDDLVIGDMPGDGADRLFGDDGNDTIYGGAGGDSIEGGAGADFVVGEDGDDFVGGGTSDDVLFGGLGADTLAAGDGRDTLLGDAGNDSLDGAGDDDMAIGAEGDDGLDGGAGNDLLLGDAGNDTARGADGIDTIWAGSGGDSIDGGNGDDFMVAEDGSDTVLGGAGNDALFGGIGDDALSGGGGQDFLLGDAGNDFGDGDDGDDFAAGGTGNDTLTGGNGNDFLIGEAGADSLLGGDGDDRVLVDATDLAAAGGTGSDTLFVGNNNADGLVAIDLGGADQNASGSGPVVSGFEAVDASAASVAVSIAGVTLAGAGNLLVGSSFADTIIGSNAADTIQGGAGADQLDAGLGPDSVAGGAGNDTLAGGAGNDTLAGGEGTDCAQYAGHRQDYLVVVEGGVATVTDINPADGDDGTDVLTSVELLKFNDDTISGDAPVAFQPPRAPATGTILGAVPPGPELTGPPIFTITGGNQSGAFAIDPQTGQLMVVNGGAIDFDTTPSIDITITISDGSATETVTVTIDLNDNAPAVDAAAFSLAENTASGTPIGQATAADPDAGTEFQAWSIAGGSGAGSFIIDPDTGIIAVANGASLDFEAATSYSLLITVSDGVNGSAAQAVTIALSDVNEPPALANTSLSVPENAANGTQIVAVTAADPDAGETLVYAILAGNVAGAFAIEPSTGVITVANPAALDFESAPLFTLIVSVTDSGSFSDTASVVIALTDVDETIANQAPIDIELSNAVVSEGFGNVLVGALSTIDPDAGDGHGYSLVSVGDAAAFTLVGDQLFVGPSALDFEAGTTRSVTLRSTDTGGLFVDRTFTITVGDVDEPPAIGNASFATAENAAAGTVVGAVSASDPEGGPLTYAITGGNAGGAFAINAASGQIAIANDGALDFETAPAFTLTVTATDAGGLTGTGSIVIGLLDVNEPPNLVDAGFALAENTVNGTVIGSLVASDPDAGSALVYALTGGNTGGAFAINSATGALSVASSAALNFETTPVFTLIVAVTDAGGLADTATVVIALSNVNEPPSLADTSFTIAEASAAGSVVGSLTLGNTEGGDPVVFAIAAGNPGGGFAIDPTSGTISVANAAVLDFETAPVFTLTVTATDSGSLTDGATVIVTLTNVNEAPSATPASFALPENAPIGTAIGTVVVTDPDAGDTLSYAITAGNGSGAFAVNPSTGAISVADPGPLDFETTPIFTLTVTATDSGSLGATATVVVTLIDVNETIPNRAPTDIALTSTTIVENAANATIGTLATVDPDAGDSHSYSIVPVGDGASFTIVGSELRVGGNGLDFEAGAVRSVTIRSIDSGGLFIDAVFAITVTNVNEPPAVVDASFSIAENAAAGAVVGVVAAGDPDAGDTLAYAITAGNVDGAFAIDAAGQVTVANPAALDFELGPTFALTVEVADGGSLTDTATVVVALADVNEPPAVGAASFLVAENAAIGAPVGTVTSADPDLGDGLTIAITAGNDAGVFAIDPASGLISVANGGALDFETAPVFTLVVTATDGGSLSDSATIVIALTDANEVPSAGDAGFSLVENPATGTVLGAVTASDPDLGDTLTYAIVAGNAAGSFAIDPATGAISVADGTALDFETTPPITLTISVTDSGSLTDTARVIVTLTNINEPPAVADASFALAENSPDGQLIGTLVASDPDAGDTLAFAITAGNDTGIFTINAVTGALSIANGAPLDFEATPAHTLTVTVADIGSLSDAATVIIGLTDVNEAPILADASFLLAENAANGTVVGSLLASDPDAGDTLAFSIIAGNTGGAFAIDPATGQVTVANGAALDFEITSVFTLTFGVMDSGSLSDTASVIIALSGANDPPLAADDIFILAENASNGTILGTVAASDPDPGDTLTYAITAGNGASAFAIDPATGAISVANGGVLDFEVTPSFTLTVTVTDAGSLSDVAAITISLTNVNEAPIAEDASFVIAENAVAGSNVGNVVASDTDLGDTLVYAITGGNAADGFAIDAASGAITVADPTALDFEATPRFTLTVSVTDAGSLTDLAAMIIDLADVNEPPTLAEASFSIAENAALGALVGTLAASDPDGSDVFAFAITGGNGAGIFTIDAVTGELSVANGAPLDFEAAPTYTLAVSVTDSGSLNDTATIVIDLTDVNEAPLLADASFLIAENVADGTIVGSLVASDPDAGDTLTFSIITGNTDGAFAVDPATGQITVANGAALDFETASVVTLTFGVADSGSLSDTATVIIALSDRNDAPVLAASTFAVAENSPNGTVVSTVVAADPDLGDTLSYAITAGDGAFTIDSATGAIMIIDSSVLDFETAPSITLTVTVTDVGSLSDVGAITIILTNVNEAPTAEDASLAIPENAAVGAAVGAVMASDPDAGDTLAYAISGGNAAGGFVIDAATGAITVADPTVLDFEVTPRFTLTVSVTDAGSLADTATMIISLADVNEAPAAADASFTLAENAAPGTTVGTIAASDPDTGDTLIYAISDGNAAGAFAIDATTGAISVADSALLDVETHPAFTLTVTVSDSGSLVDTASIIIALTNVNEAPSIADASFTLPENAPTGTAVGTPAASDPDAADTLAFAIVSGNASGAFAIDPASGEITVADSAPLDFETTPVFTLSVSVTDAGSLADSATVVIGLSDVDEAPPNRAPTDISLSANAAAENSADVLVGVLSTTDPDTGDAHSYAIVPVGDGSQFAIQGNELRVGPAGLDFEAGPTRSVTIRTSDAGGLFFDETFVIAVTNVNEPPGIADASFAVAENAANGSVVGTVTASDPDAGEILAFAITAGNGAGAFAINASGQITVANGAALDFETTPTHTLTIRATDLGSLTDTATVIVTLTDANDGPAAAADQWFVSRGTAVQWPASVLIANDSDQDGDPLSVTAVGNAASATVGLASGVVNFTANAAASSFQYSVSDGHGGGATGNVSVTGLVTTSGADTVTVASTPGAFAYIDGAGGNDSITAGASTDRLFGGAGNDTIDGGDGNDSIEGGTGLADRLSGGNGNDVISDVDGVFSIRGGEGNDTISANPPSNSGQGTGAYIRGDNGNDVIDLVFNSTPLTSRTFAGDSNTSLASADSAAAGDGNDTITFSGSWSTSGTTAVLLNGGNDAFTNNSTSSVIRVHGGPGNDTITGAGGSDLLEGGADADSLVGGGGADTLVGGNGADTMTGGAGDDRLRWNLAAEFGDRITDFDPGGPNTSTDRLEFSTPGIGLGNDNNNERFRKGDDAAINVAIAEIGVKTDASVATAAIQAKIDSYSAITSGALFVFHDSTKGHAVLYYDASPSTAGGAVLVADLPSLVSLAGLDNFNRGDFNFF